MPDDDQTGMGCGWMLLLVLAALAIASVFTVMKLLS